MEVIIFLGLMLFLVFAVGFFQTNAENRRLKEKLESIPTIRTIPGTNSNPQQDYFEVLGWRERYVKNEFGLDIVEVTKDKAKFQELKKVVREMRKNGEKTVSLGEFIL